MPSTCWMIIDQQARCWLIPSFPTSLTAVGLRRFAARISGLASGLALTVRSAGAAEVSGVKGGRLPPIAWRRAAGAPLTPEGRPGQCAAFRHW